MGESKKAFAADVDVKLRTHVGGQALIEGIMMRGRYNWAVAVRQPDGQIYTEEHDLASGRAKNAWMSWPVIRGCTAFVESLALGFKALDIAAEHAYDLEEEEGGAEGQAAAGHANEEQGAVTADTACEGQSAGGQAGASAVSASVGGPAGASDGAAPEVELTESAASEGAAPAAGNAAEAPVAASAADDEGESSGGMGVLMTVSMVIGVVLGVVIFMMLPAAISNLVLGEGSMNSAAWNILDGCLRIAIFIAYIWLISLMKDIHRMFQYHGAEHQTIHCFEHGLEMTPENAAQFPRLHVRCGTAFTIMVMIVAIFVYTVLGEPINALVGALGVTAGPLRFVLVMLVRILLLPVIAGLSYEITVKWAGQRPENKLVKIILWPGMQMQRITTKVPDEGMLECAITAMNIVLAREEAEAAKKQAAGQELAATEGGRLAAAQAGE